MRQGGSAPARELNSLIRRCGDIRLAFENLGQKQITPCTHKSPQRNGARPGSEHAAWGLQARCTGGSMSNGRSERRIARTLSVEVCVGAAPKLNGRMLTENVSAHGARVFMERRVEPGQQVLVSSPKEGVRSPARIVYCQRVSEGRFAVGLELSGRVELWAKPY